MKFLLATLSCSFLILACGEVETSETSIDAGVLFSCGNGTVETGEECDDGNQVNTDTCLNSCVMATCGDNVVGPGELCDDGNVDDELCTENCTITSCGNGVVEGVEECDDGNGINSDACLTTCKTAICGDTFVEDGTEECDDGNDDNSDACLTTCQTATCGDTFVEDGTEECDDGNDDNSDACVACSTATCGDGFVEVATEECDDSNDDNSDACVACKPATCGDGFVEVATEECDDSNSDEADSCSAQCVDLFFSGSQANCSDEASTLCGYFNAECRVDSANIKGGSLCYWPAIADCALNPGILVESGSEFALANGHLTIPTNGACMTHIQNLECEIAAKASCTNVGGAGCFQEKTVEGGVTVEPPICFWNAATLATCPAPGLWTLAASLFAMDHPTAMPAPGQNACITQIPNL